MSFYVKTSHLDKTKKNLNAIKLKKIPGTLQRETSVHDYLIEATADGLFSFAQHSRWEARKKEKKTVNLSVHDWCWFSPWPWLEMKEISPQHFSLMFIFWFSNWRVPKKAQKPQDNNRRPIKVEEGEAIQQFLAQTIPCQVKAKLWKNFNVRQSTDER